MWQPKRTSTPTFTRPLTPIETHIETPSFTHTQTHILKNHPDSCIQTHSHTYPHTLIHTQIIHLLYSPTQKCSHLSQTHSLMLLLTHTYYQIHTQTLPYSFSKMNTLSLTDTQTHIIQHTLTYSNTTHSHLYTHAQRHTLISHPHPHHLCNY